MFYTILKPGNGGMLNGQPVYGCMTCNCDNASIQSCDPACPVQLGRCNCSTGCMACCPKNVCGTKPVNLSAVWAD